ncbi:MAG: gliding motility-associated C-terminal domain-containing protein [Bacteroidetes bacterium]|nr:gliding motility-associated C-terminal domain-containing protein [Bacteroidota bacterium]
MRSILTSFLWMGFLIASAQTIPAPDFRCVFNDGSTDSLTWGIPIDPCGGAFVAYHVMAKFGANGTWDTIFSVTDSTKTFHLNQNNGDTVFYYVFTERTCVGFTPIPSDTLDNINPSPPEIKFVTVVPNGIDICWETAPDPETYEYNVYHFPDGITSGDPNLLTSQKGRNYSHLGVETNTVVQGYTVATLDSCGNQGIRNQNPHLTMYMSLELFPCTQEAVLSWSPYIGWSSIRNYYIFIDNQLFDSTSQETYSYAISNTDSFLTFKIRATRGDGKYQSFSNEVSELMDIIRPVEDVDIKLISISGSAIEIEWETNLAVDIKSFKVVRGITSIVSDTIVTLPISTFGSKLTYTDNNSVTPGSQQYYYRIFGVDVCGIEAASNLVRTGLLSGKTIQEVNHLDVSIAWSPVKLNQQEELLSYTLFREIDGQSIELAQFDTSVTTYLDDITDIQTEDGKFNYLLYTDYRLDGITYTTISNVLEILPIHYPAMPNAFTPDGDGLNDIFIPVSRFLDPNFYRFAIYDRWGGLIFETNDPQLGWDGNHKNSGNIVPQGVYVFLLEFQPLNSNNGQRLHGSVLLLR